MLDNKFIKKTDKTMKQLQNGGMEVVHNVLKRKRDNEQNTSSKQQRIEPTLKRKRPNIPFDVQKERHNDYAIYYLQSLFSQRVIVTYEFKYVIHYGEYDYEDSKTGIIRDIPDYLIEQHLDTLTSEYAERQPYDCDILEIDYTTQLVPHQQVALLEQRMFGTVLNYHHLNLEPNFTNENICVYQHLITTYSKHIKGVTFKGLMNIFEEGEIDTGVTTNQVVKFCEKYGICLYAMDLEFDIFCRHIPKVRNHHAPCLIYIVANNHMYPVLEEELRRTIVASERTKGTNKSRVFKSKEKQVNTFDGTIDTILNAPYETLSQLENCNVVYTNKIDLSDLVVYLAQTEQTVYKTRGNGGHIVRIEYKNNVIIEVNKHYQESLLVSKALTIPFRNQNLISLVLEAFQIYKGDDAIESTFNRLTQSVFFNCVKGAIVDTFYEPSVSANLKSFDIQKCHTACLTINNEMPWSVFSIFDEVKPYSGKLRTGFYYVETENTFPLRGTRWYSAPILRYCLLIGVPLKIVYEIIPSKTLKADYFNDFVKRIYDKSGDNAKLMINCFVGCLNKRSDKKQTDRFTMSLNDVIRYFFSNENTVYSCISQHPKLYHISIKNDTPKHFNTIPIYWQVIDNGNMMLHQLAMKMGGRIVKLKTDCVVVEDGNDVECKPGIGNYRLEAIPKDYKVSEPFKSTYKFQFENKEWIPTENRLERRLLTGMAGTGKSTEVRDTIKELEPGSFVLLASTNKAARLINGQTVHHFFHIDNNDKCNLKEAVKAASRYQYIFIDEVGMLRATIYEILYYVKLQTKVKFVLVGDYKQLGGVERNNRKYNYLNTMALKELVDYSITELLINHRSDNSVTVLFDIVHTLNPSDFDNKHLFTRVNLAYTHNKRKQINEIMMQRDKLKKKKMLRIEANNDDPNSQDVLLMVGSPVISNRNYKKLGLVNSATFVVKKIEPLLLLEDTVTKDKIEITVGQFRLYFWVNYCSTVHRVQGDSIREPFTIHEWSRMAKDMRYTAISRTTKKEYINVVDDHVKHKVIKETDFDRMKQKKKRERDMKDELKRMRIEAVRIINYIIRKGCSDDFSLKHTFAKRRELLERLGIPDGVVPRGYEIDHIRPRCHHTTDDDFRDINAYWNLQLISRQENNELGQKLQLL
ncbi:hypothetical protein BDR26DRAFT_941086 [Obelidium mucronatum]|nr:hypothetical protein BDR26DRAFT_941086 [Obelidium mucronatum]